MNTPRQSLAEWQHRDRTGVPVARRSPDLRKLQPKRPPLAPG